MRSNPFCVLIGEFMTWLLILYLPILVLIGVLGIIDDIASRASILMVIGGLFTTALEVTFVFLLWRPEWADTLGYWILPMFIFGAVWELVSLATDLDVLNHHQHDDSPTPGEKGFAVVILLVVTVPAYVCGAMAFMQTIGTPV